MIKKITPQKPLEIPVPKHIPELGKPVTTELPQLSTEDPDIIPEENPFESSPPMKSRRPVKHLNERNI